MSYVPYNIVYRKSTREQYHFIYSIIKNLSKSNYKLFIHLFCSTISQYRQINENSGGWLYVPAWFIRDKFRGSNPEILESLGLILINKTYSQKQHRTRGYKVNNWILYNYLCLPISEFPQWVDILNGKPWIGANDVTIDNIQSNNIPKLVHDAMCCFEFCYFNKTATTQHLNDLQAQYEKTPTDSNMCRFINDRLCFDYVNKTSTPLNDDIHYFKPFYRMQTTGRISTPLQSCSREMKQAAYQIDGIHNYDLTASQMMLASYEMNKHGISSVWLDEYIQNKSKRGEIAGCLKVSEKTWKEILYTLLMTASVPTNITFKPDGTHLPAIIATLQKELKNDEAVKTALEKLRGITRPLIKSLNDWHKKIKVAAKENGSITNALGIRRQYREFNNKSEMVAHILQGLEAYFIHTLTTLGEKNGFVILANEHDGLITDGPIPDEAITEAKRLTGLDCLELRLKPFI